MHRLGKRALTLVCAAAVALTADAAKVTFQNSARAHLYVLTMSGAGACDKKPTRKTQKVAPQQKLTVDGGANSICYIYSTASNPEQAPFHAEIVNQDRTIVLSGEPTIEANVRTLAKPRRLDTTSFKHNTHSAVAPTVKVAKAEFKAKIEEAQKQQQKQGQEEPLPGTKPGPVTSEPGPSPHDAPDPPIPVGVPEYRWVIGDFNDPVNRQSITDCVQEAWGKWPWGGEWRTCTGWRTRWRCMHHKYVVVFPGYSQQQIEGDVQACVATAGVATLAAAAIAYFSGGVGPDPTTAFLAALSGCLIDRGRERAAPKIEESHDWTEWGGC
jgi:hypothetical protein